MASVVAPEYKSAFLRDMNEEFARRVERVNFGHKIIINWIIIRISLILIRDIASGELI